MDVGFISLIPWDVQTVVPSDSAAPATPAKAEGATPRLFGIYVGGTGDVTVVTEGGSTATYKAVPVGTTIYGRFTRVKSTGTNATLMLALYQLT